MSKRVKVYVQLHRDDPKPSNGEAYISRGDQRRRKVFLYQRGPLEWYTPDTPTWRHGGIRGLSENVSHYSLWTRKRGGEYLASGAFNYASPWGHNSTFTLDRLVTHVPAIYLHLGYRLAGA